MRCIKIFLLSLLLLLNYNFANAEEQWKEYSSFMDQFYYLDKQNFNNIVCEIYVPVFNDMVKQTKEQLQDIKDKIEIKENLSDFKLNLNKENGFTFIKPSLDIKIISEEGLQDRIKVDKGIEIMKTGFQMHLEGTLNLLKGLFAMYISPDSEQLKIKQISKDNNAFRVVYEIDGSQYTDIYSGNRCVSELVSASQKNKILIKSEFMTINDKSVTKTADMHLDNAGSIHDVKMTIDYQMIDKIVFPAKIATQFKAVFPDGQMEGQSELFLRNCKID
jgi:hypothetical protein